MSQDREPGWLSAATLRALWLDQIDVAATRPPLSGDVDVDVAIVGGGFSGLWTAYYLAKHDPTLRIQIIERHHCGYGASGRNGGWAVGELASGPEVYERRSSRDAAVRQARGVFDAVDEIGRVAELHRIECDYAKGGWIRLARTSPQAERQRVEMQHHRDYGFTDDEVRLLEPDEARRQLNATNVRSGIHFGPCAALHPGKLVNGLAAKVEAMGVTIVEGTTVSSIGGGVVETDHGTVRADVVIRATEAYTRDLAGERRTLLPVYSLMVATEPLPDDAIDEIGLTGRPTFSDDRFMVIYGQRTADNRLAFGGRGVPYLFGSKIAASAETHGASHELLRQTLVEMLPRLADTTFTHRWGGVLGIPRNWVPGLTFDRRSGLGALGGYVGEGVAAANLAGRTMADLILQRDTERSRYPWVGASARKWEPEPVRWLGVRGSRAILSAADDREQTTDREAKLAIRVSRLLRGA